MNKGVVKRINARLILSLALIVSTTCTSVNGRLERPFSTLDEIFRSFSADGLGCAAIVLRKGIQVYANASGVIAKNSAKPLSPEMSFDTGSVSKSFTASLLLYFADQGRLSLHSPVSNYVDSLPEWGRDVSVEDLLAMRSGVPDFRVAAGNAPGWKEDYLYDSTSKTSDAVTFDDVMQSIRSMPALKFLPGTQYDYSNSNYTLLRAVAEQITGTAFSTLIIDHAHDMANVNLSTPRFTEGLREVPSEVVGHDLGLNEESVASVSHWDVLGPSSVWISIDDLARWGNALISDEQAFANQSRLRTQREGEEDQPRGYAAGFMVLHRKGERIVYHLGGTEGFSSGLLIRPEHEEVLAFSCNMSPQLLIQSGTTGSASELFKVNRELVFLNAWLVD